MLLVALGMAWAHSPTLAGAEQAPPAAPADPSAHRLKRPRGTPLHWAPHWSKVGPWDASLVLAVGAVGLAATHFGPDPVQPRPRRLALDESVRGALRGRTERGRVWARDASDLGLAAIVAYPLLADSLIHAAWYRNSPEVAVQMAAIDLEAYAVTGGLTALVKALVLRERPYGRTCGAQLHPDTADCRELDRHYSHFSGHASFAFTAASLVCTQNLAHSLHGATATWLPCAGGYALASGVALLRVMSDRHYASDVLVGAAVGATSGWLIPWLHYRDAPTGTPAKSWLSQHRVRLAPTHRTLGIQGVF